MKQKIVTILATLTLLAASGGVQADPAKAEESRACGAHQKMVEQLGLRFKEKRRAFGLISNERMMEVFVSKRGSWTMLVTTTDKNACVVAAGESWEQWHVEFDPET